MICPTKTLGLNLVILFFASIAMGQQSTCDLKLNQLTQSPELFGFHHGMTFEEVKARVPQVRFPLQDQVGVAKTTINPGYSPGFDTASFEGVRSVSMDFLDGRLTTLWIAYNGSFKWQTLEEFIPNVSKALKLPANWSRKELGQELTCDGFSAFASMIGGSPALRIADEAAQETIAARRAEAAAAAEAAKAAAKAVVIGDTRTKLYYSNDCEELDRVPEASRSSFTDKDAAEKAGYRRAKDCP